MYKQQYMRIIVTHMGMVSTIHTQGRGQPGHESGSAGGGGGQAVGAGAELLGERWENRWWDQVPMG